MYGGEALKLHFSSQFHRLAIRHQLPNASQPHLHLSTATNSNMSTPARRQAKSNLKRNKQKLRPISVKNIKRGFSTTPGLPPISTPAQLEEFFENSRPQADEDDRVVFSPVGYMPRKTIPLQIADMRVDKDSWETRGASKTIRVAKAYTPADGDAGEVLGMIGQFCKCIDEDAYGFSWLATKEEDDDDDESRMAVVPLTWGKQTPEDPVIPDRPCTVHGSVVFSRSQDGKLSASLFVNKLE